MPINAKKKKSINAEKLQKRCHEKMQKNLEKNSITAYLFQTFK
jgi:hypothetical protein